MVFANKHLLPKYRVEHMFCYSVLITKIINNIAKHTTPVPRRRQL